MIIDCSKEMRRLGRMAERFVNGNSKANDLLRDATLSIGPANDPHYGIPAGAVQTPTFVGDSAALGQLVGNNAQMEALYKQNKANVNMRPTYNPSTGKYDMVLSKATQTRYTGDSGELLSYQTISPWNASYFPEIFKQPLLYSHARDLVKRKSGGSNPWGEVQNLQLAAYSGWAQLDGAGTVAANLKKNVNVQGGLMVNPIINIKVFFNFTIEEMQRAEGGNGSPFAGTLMAEKQRYAQYVIDMVTDYLTYYGNSETNTPGLFDINGITTWQTGSNKSLAQIAADTTDQAKGNTMYSNLAKLVRDFMDASYNKFDVIRIAMAPAAYNLLASTNYSNVYNPEGAMKIFMDNFEAGVTKSGSKPKIEIYADPMLAANNGFNDDQTDRLVITAPEVGAGPQDEKQDLLLLGVPLENFVYPVYPNSFDQQHAVLRRFSGVFAPVAQAVKVYSGFGI